VVIASDLVREGKVARVKYLGLRSHVSQKPSRLLNTEPGIRAIPQRAIEQEDLGSRIWVAKANRGPFVQVAAFERRKMVEIWNRA
jgi:hypothetical protein